MAEVTPMMRQYLKIKEEHQDCILFFRLGDFYEMFNDDARLASKELDLTLTTRDRSKENPEERVPMCGVPYHSSEAYIARLISKGYKVAICEQTEDPALAKGLVDREVIRIVTPGMVIDSSMLEEGKSNYICSVFKDGFGTAVCFADISTGEITATSFGADEGDHVLNELIRFSPVEAVLNDGAAEDKKITEFLKEKLNCLVDRDNGRFDFMQASMRICEQFNTHNLDTLGIGDDHAAVCAVGGLLSYIRDTQKTELQHINNLDFYTEGRYMELDVQTVRNLEIVSTLRTMEKKGSLLWVIDKTKTPMGSRMMRAWLSRPLLNAAAIKRRQNAVQALFADNVRRNEIISCLKNIGDIERLIGKIVYGTANGRDLVSISDYIGEIPKLLSQLSQVKTQSPMICDILNMDKLEDCRQLIGKSICDNPPFSIREGNIIKDGYDSEVDRLRGLLTGSTRMLSDIEIRERERTGKKLKVGYNRVFGYYIEVPRSMSSDVPADYVRKQTLTNCERFITQELKELENELLTAKDRLEDLEFRIFSDIREKIASQVSRIQDTAGKIAELDVLSALADVAVRNNYCMPEIDVSGSLEIRDGRHPVVEIAQKNVMFVPNDVDLDDTNCVAAIITGPNMAGKSTYMRQTALIVLLAQMGSFVPARSAHIGIVDRVFTRIGASDDLSAGKSTFMVEMSEVSEILRSATKKSLLILDEIGRGTSTYDGMSIARAVLEYCADKSKLGAKTMFATHYHELSALEGQLPGVKNFNISVKKRGDDIIFLRKIVSGGADESYGIEVAKLAGVPESVIKRAKSILSSLEAGSDVKPSRKSVKKDTDDMQISMLDMGAGEIIETLKSTNIDTITPIEAMNILYELKKKVGN